MNTRDALIASIIAETKEDTPRLAFADFVEEEGETERATFIRTQIALACRPRRIVVTEQVVIEPHGPRCWTLGGGVYTEDGQLLIISNPKIDDRIDILKPRTMRKDLKAMYGLRLSQIRDDNDEYVVVQDEESRRDEEGEELRKQERELLKPGFLKYLPGPFWRRGNIDYGWSMSGDRHNIREVFTAEPRRGFLSTVTCAAADWLTHGDTLTWHPEKTTKCKNCWGWSQNYGNCEMCGNTGQAPRPCPPTAQPITHVTLTTRPLETERIIPQNDCPVRYYGLAGDPEEKWIGGGKINDNSRPGPDSWLLSILELRWPGVTFHLPPEIDQQVETRERTLRRLSSMLQIPREDVTRSTVESALGIFQRNPNPATEHMILPLQNVLQDGSW